VVERDLAKVEVEGSNPFTRSKLENNMLLIGDVHGKFDQYARILDEAEKSGPIESIQIGDMGVGFGVPFMNMGPDHRFIRGNHDNPAECRKSPNYMGDYGYWPDKKIYYIGGAYSVDFMYRAVGVSWWPDEELSIPELQLVIEDFVRNKPDIVITHECPTQIRPMVLPNAQLVQTKTDQALQLCFERWKPALWVFGHYHTSWTRKVGGTEFRCLNELETFTI
jgi:hypothetical protein